MYTISIAHPPEKCNRLSQRIGKTFPGKSGGIDLLPGKGCSMIRKQAQRNHPLCLLIVRCASPFRAAAGLFYYPFSGFSTISSGILASGVAPGW